MKTTDPKVLIASAALFMTASIQAMQPEVLYAFQAVSSESPANANGANPLAGLVLGSDRNFYGTTVGGGTSGHGTVFRVMTSGSLTTLASFDYPTTGMSPQAGLTLGNDGNFYGTTAKGGSSDVGTVFRVTTNGVLTKLVSLNGTNGGWPSGGLLLGNDDNFYGTTREGGSNGSGTVFKVTTNGVLTTLVSFSSTFGNPSFPSPTNADGTYPLAALVLGNDGNLYGTTAFGGTSGNGTVFKLTADGLLITLVSFNGDNGANPEARLLLGGDGNFYGTTRYGGSGWGTVFKVTTNGVLSTLASFTGLNGAGPNELMMGQDGNLYGTTFSGGPGGGGTIFRLVISAFTGAVRQPGGSVLLTGTGPANGGYRLWASADLSLPVTAWTLLTSASFDGNGSFSYKDAGAATSPSRFYQLSMP